MLQAVANHNSRRESRLFFLTAYRGNDLTVHREGKGTGVIPLRNSIRQVTKGCEGITPTRRGVVVSEPVTRSPRFQLTGFLSRGVARSPTALYELPADFSCHRVSYFKRTGKPVGVRGERKERERERAGPCRSGTIDVDAESGPRARKPCV